MPYPVAAALLKKEANPSLQFIVHDFNADGNADIYLNFSNPFSRIPPAWKKAGIRKKQVIISYKNKKMTVEDYHGD